MVEYAPEAIGALFDDIHAAFSSAQMSGIIGDSAHTYGYHRGRNYVDSWDYSVQQSDDKQGSGEAACGLDVSLNDADMQTVTQRLISAVDRSDPALLSLREFYGTTDGREVTGRDVRTGNWITSDDSHLWHVHLSIYRRWADDEGELCGNLAPIITAREMTEDELMTYYKSKAEYEDKMFSLMTKAVQQFLKYGPDGHTYGFDTLIAKRLGPVHEKLDKIDSQVQ